MANRTKILERFSAKTKRPKGISDEGGKGGHKKRRPDFSNQRRQKEAVWDDQEDND